MKKVKLNHTVSGEVYTLYFGDSIRVKLGSKQKMRDLERGLSKYFTSMVYRLNSCYVDLYIVWRDEYLFFEKQGLSACQSKFGEIDVLLSYVLSGQRGENFPVFVRSKLLRVHELIEEINRDLYLYAKKRSNTALVWKLDRMLEDVKLSRETLGRISMVIHALLKNGEFRIGFSKKIEKNNGGFDFVISA